MSAIRLDADKQGTLNVIEGDRIVTYWTDGEGKRTQIRLFIEFGKHGMRYVTVGEGDPLLTGDRRNRKNRSTYEFDVPRELVAALFANGCEHDDCPMRGEP